MLIDKIFEQARSTPLRTAFVHNGLACSHAGFARRIADAHDALAGCDLPAGSAAAMATAARELLTAHVFTVLASTEG